MEEEEWRTVVREGFMGLYQISSLGRAWSNAGLRPNRHGTLTLQRGRVLKQPTRGRRYLAITLAWDGVKKTAQTHELVAEAFIGPRPPGAVIKHKNGNSHDNRLVNLEYGTASENIHDEVRHNTHRNSRKIWCKRAHPLVEPLIVMVPNPRNGSIARICVPCRSARARLKSRGLTGDEALLRRWADQEADLMMPGWREWQPPHDLSDPLGVESAA